MNRIFMFRKNIIRLALLGLFSSGFLLAGPYLSKLFIDTAFMRKDAGAFFKFCIIGSAVFIASAITKAFADTIKNRALVKTKLDLAGRLARKFYSLDLAFLQSKSVGENIYRLSDVERVARFYLERVPSIMVDCVKVFIILGIALWVNFRMSLCMVALSPLLLLQGMYMRRKLKPLYEELWRSQASLAKKLHESFSRMAIIKGLGLERVSRAVYIKLLLQNIRIGLKGFRLGIINSLGSSFLAKGIFGLISLFGGWMIIKGELSLGSYTAAILYLTQLGGLAQSLSSGFDACMQDSISVRRFFEILEKDPAIKDSFAAEEIRGLSRAIEFRELSFSYSPEKQIFEKLTFRLPAGQWIGLVGLSGCGKTTLVNLLLRIYDPVGGSVLYDGVDARKIKLNSLRSLLSIAAQDPYLFDLSIKENIALGVHNCSMQSIEEAIVLVQLDGFVKGLAQRIDTLIGENAYQLSQGLKQRVALARAIVRRPSVLILDEATSSIDSETEEKIFKALRERRKGLTTIVISHRLFTVRDADRIFFLQEPKIIEEGTHDELFVKSNSYHALFRNQLEETAA